MMMPRFLKSLWPLCVSGVLMLGGNGALAAGNTADEPLPTMLSPGGSQTAPAANTASMPTPPAMPPIVSPQASPTAPSPVMPEATSPDLPAPPPLTTPSMLLPAPVGDQSATDQPTTGYQPLSSDVTVAQMGQTRGITLAGGQAQAGVIFTLPGDQVVTNARLDLALRVSPELAALNTSMQLMLNGQPLGSVPLNAVTGDSTLFQLDIPAAMVVSSNNLSFRVNDADRLLCERDSATRYNLTILPTTTLHLEGQQLDIGTRLENFPRPFIDPLQMSSTSVPMVFPANLTPAQVSAASLVASWLGMRMDGYGVTFPVIRDALPEKSGIVFGRPGDNVGTLTLPEVAGPTLQLIDNPVNPVYKLMLVIGKDDEQLRQAAYRLINQPFTGDASTLSVTPQTIPFRRAYDAPRWINTDRPVRLSELLRNDQNMTVSGLWHEALRINFRAAPDLFLWDGDTIPVNVDYRFPSESWIDESRSYLNVMLNGTFLHNLPVNKVGVLQQLWREMGGDSRQENYTLKVDPYLIYGYNQFQLYFNIRAKEDAPCSVLLNNNIKSQIADSASIDLSRTRHFTLLPNLSYFVGVAFPFTRQADYAQTVMLLPEKPTNAEIGLLLDLAGRAGDATGVSLNHNRVMFGLPTNAGDRQKLENSDVLAVTSLQQTAFNQNLLSGSPYTVNDRTFGVRTPGVWEHLQTLLIGDWNRTPLEADRYFSSNEAWRGFLSYRSPWNPDRVVVVATGSGDDQLLRLYGDLSSPSINAAVRGDTAIITDENGVRSFRVGPQFPSGEMPWYMMVVWYANQHAVLLALMALLLAAVMGLSLASMLRRLAEKRLSTRRDAGSDKE
ncbi:cellulose biosynthesis cyclic di-GMP-binding regulatory protein BcsB [Dickeya sp. CFBP 2040]|uniref:cellulose biosynthesis cyclic di-GMP-binding regulatory protein BcsB n=1 Tax=Dickeya sp. CFBP 2040 TaxID=2718531 RepID=UPI001444E070|nr:cellulose biosynthesis cyclic di-GMP-binding regulatory protein BcsB [Dickeya sp. CFBP 2040]NKI74809.1 cellulose biosynthesis cyclic di-GMP-binding regulatory protein BcsB [Dickeya sp. CFBP 2040]